MATSWMRSVDMRTLASFPVASRAALQAGQPVTAGDGRTFQMMNGHLVSVGSPTWKIGAEIRSGVRDASGAVKAGGNFGATATTDLRGDDPNGRNPNAVGTPGNPAPQGATGEQKDSYIRLQETLGAYGLSGLATTVFNWIIDGKSEAEIERDIRETKEFKAEFPEIEIRTKAGKSALSPAEILDYRRNAAQMMRAAGLPKDFYDGKDDFTKFIAGDVSLAELNDRVQIGRDAAYNAPAEVREALRRDYGVDEGGLTAFFLDPDRAQPLLEKQYNASKIGGAAFRTGFGTTSREQNERLAELGVSEEQAQQGFGALTESRELFTSLNSTEDNIDTDTQLGAAFGGDAAASRKVERRRRSRQSQFEGGGSVAATQQGVVGLSDTRR